MIWVVLSSHFEVMKNIPIYYSPADFANNNSYENRNSTDKINNENGCTSIPMRSSANDYTFTQHSLNYQPQQYQYLPPHSKYHMIDKRDGYSTFRLLFFITIFCISGIIIYFTLNRVYGTDVGSALSNNARLFKRSIPDDLESIQFTIIVFGWKRRGSLERLVHSLKESDYLNKKVSIQFQIEADPSEEVKAFVKSYQWPHGEKKVIFRTETYGLKRMVLESWYPAKTDKEFAFFFEDDIEVSPLYFKFTWELLNRADIFKTKLKDSIVGIALNTPRFDEVNEIHSIWIPPIKNGSELFLFQQPCSWGALYFPWSWRQFLQYYNIRTSTMNIKEMVVIPLTSIKSWKRSWKKYLMELMFLEGSVMIYPSLPNQESFSIHHREPGQHTNIEIEKQNIIKLHKNKIDFFASPMVINERGNQLIQNIKKVDCIKVTEWPIVSFHHIQVEAINILKEIGNLIFEKYFIKN